MTDDGEAEREVDEEEEKVYSARLQISLHAIFDMDEAGAPHLAALGMQTISYEGNVDPKAGSAAILEGTGIANLSPDSLTGALFVAPLSPDAKRKKILSAAIPPIDQSRESAAPDPEDVA